MAIESGDGPPHFGDAIGRHFTFDDQTRRYEIIGVVGDAKY